MRLIDVSYNHYIAYYSYGINNTAYFVKKINK